MTGQLGSNIQNNTGCACLQKVYIFGNPKKYTLGYYHDQNKGSNSNFQTAKNLKDGLVAVTLMQKVYIFGNPKEYTFGYYHDQIEGSDS